MKKGFRVIRNLGIFIAVMAGGFYLVYSLFIVPGNSSYTLEFGNIDVSVTAKALLLRDEVLVKTESSGQIQYVIAEGEKIKRNQVVAQIAPGSGESNTESDFERPEKTAVAIDMEQLEYDIAFLSTKIRYAISHDQYGEIYDLRDELEMKLDKQDKMTEISGTVAVVSEAFSNDTIQLMSPKSGVVSYYIDGYEEVLTDNNLYAIDFEKFLEQSIIPINHSSYTVDEYDSVYKIVDSNHWKLIAFINEHESDFFSEGKILNITIGDEIVTGQVIDIISQETGQALVIDMRQMISDFQKIRQVDAILNPSNYRGLVIEKGSLIKKDGDYGVYVLNVNNQVRFVPVKIIGYDHERAIVMSESYQDAGKTVRTVSLYDEVIKDAGAVK
jgi:putative membrane fusion protein